MRVKVGHQFGASLVVEDLGRVHTVRRVVVECACGERDTVTDQQAKRRGPCFHGQWRQRRQSAGASP